MRSSPMKEKSVFSLLANIIKNNFLFIILAIALAIFEVYAISYDIPYVDSTLARIGFYITLSCAMIFEKDKHYTIFKYLFAIIIPISMAIIALLLNIFPSQMDNLATEDGPIENLSALLLIVASIVWVSYSAIQAKNRSWGNLTISLIIAIIFFIIGMEEVSWGQRIFDIESSEFFLNNNWQNEMNLHNLNTDLSDRIYISGASIVLILFPFYQQKIKRFFSNINLSFLNKFMPSQWIFAPATIMLSTIGGSTTSHKSLFMFAAFFALVGLTYNLVNNIKSSPIKSIYFALLILVYISSAFSFFIFRSDSAINQTRYWASSEYIEVYIALGLFIYTVDFMFRQSKTKQPIPQSKSKK